MFWVKKGMYVSRSCLNLLKRGVAFEKKWCTTSVVGPVGLGTECSSHMYVGTGLDPHYTGFARPTVTTDAESLDDTRYGIIYMVGA